MEKIIKKYGVVIIFYLVIVASILFVNERMRILNQNNPQTSITR